MELSHAPTIRPSLDRRGRVIALPQSITFTREQMIEYTTQNPFDRFPDGRPKVPDSLIERARGLSAEEVWSVLPGKGFHNQYEDGFEVLHPGKTLVGRAFTVQFMPARPDLEDVLKAKAAASGLGALKNQTAIDMLRPGDVLVVDLFGKEDGGTIVGDNLFYYMMKTAHAGGLVVDGSIRDLEGIAQMDMPAYYRHAHPSGISGVVLTGINVPIRIGHVTVMPGDLVVGDREGVYFIPPQLAQQVMDSADISHIHDEWARKSSARVSTSPATFTTPHDPALKKEYEDIEEAAAGIRGK